MIDKLIQAIREGYVGILSDGKLVDRRDFPEARPIPKNEMLGVPEPKEVLCSTVS